MFSWRGRGRPATAVSPSGEVAKERLRLILVHDRAGCSPEFLETLKEEMVTAISRYLEVDYEGMEIRLMTNERQAVLAASIPVKSVRRVGASV